MIYKSTYKRLDYTPPLLGNGSMSLRIDATGGMKYHISGIENTVLANNYIWLAGKRYIDTFERDLIPFGKFFTELSSESGAGLGSPVFFSQELFYDKALLLSVAEYSNSVRLVSEAFVHRDKNLVCIRYHIESSANPQASVRLRIAYRQSDPQNESNLPRHMTLRASNGEDSYGFSYRVEGQECYHGKILLKYEGLKAIGKTGNEYAAEGELKPGQYAVFYVQFTEGREKAVTSADSFDSLFESHLKSYSKLWNVSKVSLPNPEWQKIYDAARYCMLAIATKWSLPRGSGDAYWNGKYFAFDEYFGFLGLMMTGQHEIAGNIPLFRYCGVWKAIQRASSQTWKEDENGWEGRFPWGTVETGEEASKFGCWYDHIFHMANIVMTCWDYYTYTLDREYLEKVYFVIKVCAKFYTRNSIYRDGGEYYIGKVTDMEELGVSVERAFMTTCAVIRCLQIEADAAGILEVDSDYARECRDISEHLKRNLPIENNMYVPYPHCKQRCISVFAGQYPYSVLSADDRAQLVSMDDYMKHEKFDNSIYGEAKKSSHWTTEWKVNAYVRMRLLNETEKELDRIVSLCGPFGEAAEVNELPKIYNRPWFMSAEGAILSAVVGMLVDRKFPNGDIFICPAMAPTDKKISFSLPVVGDITVCAKVEKKVLVECRVIGGENCRERLVNVTLPEWISFEGNTTSDRRTVIYKVEKKN